MTDPVVSPASGFTFQRPAVSAFIASFGRDPAATSPMLPAELIPNISLRDSLVNWLKQQGVRT
jgi:hypothetical protein